MIKRKTIAVLLLILVLLAVTCPVFASGYLVGTPKFRGVDDNNNPLVGGLLWTYEPGTTTPKTTYSEHTLSSANANPVVLNSRGEAVVYLASATKLVLTAAGGDPATPIWSQDYVGPSSGIGADVYNVEDYGTVGTQAAISACLAAIVADGNPSCTMYFPPATWNISTNLSISGANINLRPERGAILTRTGGTTLTISVGSIDAGDWQWISDNSAGHDWVNYTSPTQPRLAWWGLVNDGVTDNTAAIQSAIRAVSAGGTGGKFRKIEAPAGSYAISTVNFYPYVGLKGQGDATIFVKTGTGAAFGAAATLMAGGVDNFADLLTDCKIDASANVNNFYMVLINQVCMQRAIRHVNFVGNTSALQGAVHYDMGTGATGNFLYHNLIEDCEITNCKAATGAIYYQGYLSLTRPINNNWVKRTRFQGYTHAVYIDYGGAINIQDCALTGATDPAFNNGSSGGHGIPIVALNSSNCYWIGGYTDNGTTHINLLSTASSGVNATSFNWLSGGNISTTTQVVDLQGNRFFTSADNDLTYVDGTHATVVGDKTGSITVGRTCWFHCTAGWKSSTVASASYDGGTGLTTIEISDSRFDDGLDQYGQNHSFNRATLLDDLQGSILSYARITNLVVGSTTLTNLKTSTFTCANNKDTVVSDTSVTSTSFIQVMPTNAAGITLEKSAARLVITARSAGVSFTASTADDSAAAGTETFRYWIVN